MHDDFNWDDRPSKLQYTLVVAVIIILLLAFFAGLYYIIIGRKDTGVYEPNAVNTEANTESGIIENTESTEMNAESSTEDAEDPQNAKNQPVTELGAETELTKILISDSAEETTDITLGIDVSKYQGLIDWEKVAAAGIDFAMIRVGYRTMEGGVITEDDSAKYNLQEATAHGIKVGAYFFSTAVTDAEAIEEAKWTAEFISQYKITYPVAFNCEGFENVESRQYDLTKEERTSLAKAFLNQIYESGYTPMFYASKGEMEGDSKWGTSELEKSFKVWVAWYPTLAYPETKEADYSGSYDMWQYTNNGKVAGIDNPVDVNVAGFGYADEADAKNETAPEQIEANVEAGHTFTEVNEVVTAKEATNLRNIPSKGENSTVILTLYNGQTATRTGTSTSGWSRVVYNDEIYYAVSNLLTTDLTVKTPATPEPDDGIKTEFTACDEMVSPKIEVNLRSIPSVTDPNSVVVATAKYGEIFRRTGINTDHGWSRVEYNGQILYCVSSYVWVYEESVGE